LILVALEVKHFKHDTNEYSSGNGVVITGTGVLTMPIKHLKTSLLSLREDLY